MKLYHVSVNTDILKKEFVPKIPDLGEHVNGMENDTIPRVCFSETVNGCISALPKYSRNLVNSTDSKFVLYEIDTDDYPECFFLSNEKIIEQHLVYDANLTKEWWLLKPLEVKGRLCAITHVEADTVLNFALIETDEVIQIAKEIDGTILYDEILAESDKADSEACFKAINHYADQNKLYHICDRLYEELGERHGEAQSWIYNIKYRVLPEKEKRFER